MKVLFINSVCGIGSTGRICTNLADEFRKNGHDVRIAYGRGSVPNQYSHYAIRIGNALDEIVHGARSRLFDEHGLGSVLATKRFIKWATEYNPDLLWLHNIHGYYINYEILFAWIKSRSGMEVRWTLHDCWAFTGHCSHFMGVNCYKWQHACEKCVQKRAYPTSLFLDKSKTNYKRKKSAFTSVEKMMLITPSQWLADLVSLSYLNHYPISVNYNTIDTNVFKPTPNNFRQKYGVENKTLVLGVASSWNDKKGLFDFLKLSSMVDSDIAIVLVGLTPKQIACMPANIIGIQRTDSTKELAEIYSAADVFVNPTYEDNYPTVNLEAEACGTRVVCYDVGGCKETLKRQDSTVVKVGDIEALLHYAIIDESKRGL